uniref:Uncharacterized protein n=1 Tax=Lates calcarifer TaxID=8187 RepID=A0A4W6DHS6_LATCA
MQDSFEVRAHLPRIVIEGVRSLGFGSLGVPSTLAHLPMVLSHPTMLFKTQFAPWRMIDSRTLTPAPIVTPVPMETLGPNYTEKTVGSILAVG